MTRDVCVFWFGLETTACSSSITVGIEEMVKVSLLVRRVREREGRGQGERKREREREREGGGGRDWVTNRR